MLVLNLLILWSLGVAPEAFACALGECAGYSFAADWWSLGVCCYEVMRRKVLAVETLPCTALTTFFALISQRPFDIHSSQSADEVKHIFATTRPSFPAHWDQEMTDVIKQVTPDTRPEVTSDFIEAMQGILLVVACAGSFRTTAVTGVSRSTSALQHSQLWGRQEQADSTCFFTKGSNNYIAKTHSPRFN